LLSFHENKIKTVANPEKICYPNKEMEITFSEKRIREIYQGKTNNYDL
jgi:hypothetical protein